MATTSQNIPSHQEFEGTEGSEGSSLLKNSRLNFTRKVFAIVASQITLTAVFIILGQGNNSFAKFQQNHEGVFFLSTIITLVISLVLYFSERATQKVPLNYILLAILTSCEAYSVSYFCQSYPKIIVLQAAVLTAAGTLIAFLYAVTTKKDISFSGSVLFSLSGAVLIVSLLNFFFFRSSLIDAGIQFVWTIMVCFYLVYDIQLITGNSSRKLKLDNYILGALILYKDIIELFIQILKILGKNEEKDNKEKKDKKK